jgi:hypothetical protein
MATNVWYTKKKEEEILMLSLKKKFMLNSLGIVGFVFLLAFVAPQVSKSHTQELLFGLAIILCILAYLIGVITCGKQAKSMLLQHTSKDMSLSCIKFVYYGIIIALLLNIPMILFMLMYLTMPSVLVMFIGTLANLQNIIYMFTIPWGICLMVMLIHVIISIIFFWQIYILKAREEKSKV